MSFNGQSAFQLAAPTNEVLSKTRLTLFKSVVAKYRDRFDAGKADEVVDALLRIHGLHPDNFDFIKNADDVVFNKVNDISIDDSSNKEELAVESMFHEVTAPVKKLLGYNHLYKMLKDDYGKDEACYLMGELLDLSLGLSDSTNILKPYCWAMDASKLVTIGKDFGQLKSKPCKRVLSYVANLSELIHQMSNHLAGAIAVGSFFLDIAHLLIYRENVSLEALRSNADIKKGIENAFQQFVHSVNHLSRSYVESPFVNISIFDREKLGAMISEDNYGWYFPKSLSMNGEHGTYIVEFIIAVQDMFLDFFDKGDPNMGGAPYRFPVVTMNLSKTDEDEVIDRKFLDDFVNNREVYRYNIFTSAGSKVASCCRLLSDTEMLDLGSQSNSFGGSSISLGSHRVVTINFNRIAQEAACMSDFFDIVTLRITNAAKVLASHKRLLSKLKDRGLQPFIANGWINMNRLFSTFGIIGLYEADKTMKERFDFKGDFIENVLKHTNKLVLEASKRFGIIGNIEQIPAESFAVRLAKADRIIFGSTVPYEMYANQFVPLWENATVWERMAMDGKYNRLITGGGIVHATIGEKVTPEQAKKLIEFSVKSHCEHFALNSVYSKCEQGHVHFGNLTTCPTCASHIQTHFTRVVGYFVPVESWNKTRRTWEFPKRTYVHAGDLQEGISSKG